MGHFLSGASFLCSALACEELTYTHMRCMCVLVGGRGWAGALPGTRKLLCRAGESFSSRLFQENVCPWKPVGALAVDCGFYQCVASYGPSQGLRELVPVGFVACLARRWVGAGPAERVSCSPDLGLGTTHRKWLVPGAEWGLSSCASPGQMHGFLGPCVCLLHLAGT